MVQGPTKRRRSQQGDRKKWWTQGFSSVEIEGGLRIVPFWESGISPDDRTSIVIDPGPAFGLGDHPTTIMALELLQKAFIELRDLRAPTSVLDVGSGVGILSIAARLLGAHFAVAVDIDPVAVNVARRNCTVNRVFVGQEAAEGVHLCVGGVECVSGCFDLVMANLVAPLLLRIRKPLTDNSKNLLLISGIFETMVDEVRQAYVTEGFEVVQQKSREEWRSMLLRRMS